MKIKSITKQNINESVYNFHCLPNENYFSQNILVHNCYKSNTKTGRTMSFDTFKKIFDNTFLDKENQKHSFLTQIAFGADAGAKYNQDLFNMMQYSRLNGVIPNITVANLDDETADKIASVCGAASISVYDNKDIAYNTIKKLTDRGMTQVNIHVMLSEETYDRVMEVFKDSKIDPRLAKLNAIVILSLKKKGRGVSYTTVAQDRFKAIVDYALDKENGVRLGFDSCSCWKFSEAIKDYPNYAQMMQYSEPCESTLFSQYINVEGKFYSCSFCENAESFPVGVDAVNVDDFVKDVWHHPSTVAWRKNLLEKRKCGNMSCPVYDV